MLTIHPKLVGPSPCSLTSKHKNMKEAGSSPQRLWLSLGPLWGLTHTATSPSFLTKSLSLGCTATPSLSVSHPFQTVHPIDLTATGLVTLATPGKYGPDSSLVSNIVALQWFTGNAPAPRAARPISVGFPVFFTAT